MISRFREKIAEVENFTFEQLAIEAFDFQRNENDVYNRYLSYLGIEIKKIDQVEQIPFLPIEFFKHQAVQCGSWKPVHVFRSSGTTVGTRSAHLVDDLEFYLQHSSNTFSALYGSPSDWTILALLPSYQEQGESSLIAMVDNLISQSSNENSGYYSVSQHLHDVINATVEKKIMLIGVSFALLDLAEKFPSDMSNVIIIETGGMKGRRAEITRGELHERLKRAFQVGEVHSEYGMTELFSQAYAHKTGHYKSSSVLKFFIRDINDPFSYVKQGEAGAINVIDLANIHSCCFIETKDLGRMNDDGTVEILGRMDNSDIRGCNLLY